MKNNNKDLYKRVLSSVEKKKRKRGMALPAAAKGRYDDVGKDDDNDDDMTPKDKKALERGMALPAAAKRRAAARKVAAGMGRGSKRKRKSSYDSSAVGKLMAFYKK